MESDRAIAEEIQGRKECIIKEPQVGDLPWSIQAMIIDRLPTMTLLEIQAADPQWWQSVVKHCGQALTKPKQPLLIRWTDSQGHVPTSGFWVTVADFTGHWLFYQPDYLKNTQILTMDSAGCLMCCITVDSKVLVFNILTGCCKELPVDFKISDSENSSRWCITMTWDPSRAYQVIVSNSEAVHIYTSVTRSWKHYMDVPDRTQLCRVFSGDVYVVAKIKEMWKLDLNGGFVPCLANPEGCLLHLVTHPDGLLLVQSVYTLYSHIYRYEGEGVWEKLTEVPKEIMTIMYRSDPEGRLSEVSLSCALVGVSLYLLSQCWTFNGVEELYYTANEVLISYQLDSKEWKVLDARKRQVVKEKKDGNIETLCGLQSPDFSILS